MAKLFVSYSRKDSVAARKLIESFRSIEQEVWVDWESIPPAADWMEQIEHGIEEAGAFIFLISPDSIVSEVCKVELGHAVKNNKRVIPIVLRDVAPKDAPESIRKLNWTFLRESDNFEEGLAKVKTAIELDLDWLEEHRRLQVRALEWHRKKDVSLLLRGRDLRNAMQMMETYTSKDPIPTDLQKTFIQYSRRSERNRNVAVLTGTVALLIMAVLAYTAWQQSILANKNAEKAQINAAEAKKQEVIAVQKANEAEAAREQEAIQRQSAETARAAEATQRQLAEQKKIEAEAQRSAARAQIFQERPGELYISTLLAIDSMRRFPSAEAEEILRKNILLLPRPVAQLAQTAKIQALAFNRDRSVFVTGSADGSTCAWRIEETISNMFCTPDGQPAVNAVAFNADDTLIAMGDQAGLLQILDAKTGDVLHAYQRIQPKNNFVAFVDLKAANQPATYTPLDLSVRQISFNPAFAKQVAVGYSDEQVPVFDVTNGKVGSPLFTTYPVTVMSYSPRGTWLVAGSESGSISIWKSGTTEQFPPFAHRSGVFALAFSPTESKIVTGGNDYAGVINLNTKEELFRISNQNLIRALAFSPDGKRFVTASADRRVRVWDATDRSEKLSMTHDGSVTNVVYSTNGKWIASTGEDRTVRVWDADTGAQMFEIPLRASGSALMFCNNDQWLISTDDSGAIQVWDLSVMETPSVSIPSPANSLVDHVQYSPSGTQLVMTSENKLWLLTTDPESILKKEVFVERDAPIQSRIAKLVFSPNSAWIAMLSAANELVLLDTTRRTFMPIDKTTTIQAIAFSPDSRQLLVSDPEEKIHVCDLPCSAWNETSPLSNLPASTLATSAQFLTIGSSAGIRVAGMDGDGGSSAAQAYTEPVSLVINPDGTRIASTDADGRVSTWTYESGVLQLVASLNNERAVALAIHPNRDLLALGTATYVYILDLNGNELARLPYQATVKDLSFSGDGRYLAVASSTKLEIWDLDKLELITSDQLIPAACSRLYENLSRTQSKTLLPGEKHLLLCDNLPEPP